MSNLSLDNYQNIIENISSRKTLGLLLMVSSLLKPILYNKIRNLYNKEETLIINLKNNVRNDVMINFYKNLKNNNNNNNYNYIDRIYNSIAMMTWTNYLIYSNIIPLTFNENEWCCNLLDHYKKYLIKNNKTVCDDFSYYSYSYYFSPNKI